MDDARWGVGDLMRGQFRKTGPERGSHLPLLMKAVESTTGPVLELGSGMYSTCYLHWACFPTKRPLVTYEGQAAWMEWAKQFAADFHTVTHITDWDRVDYSAPWSVVLVDHDAPNTRRGLAVEQLAHVEYVVCHDTDRPGKHGYDVAFQRFKYQWRYRNGGPYYTTIVSNIHDLSSVRVS